MTKVKKLRNNEYYDIQNTYDKLYADSKNGKRFNNYYIFTKEYTPRI